ncbi:excalibur calcium-binding domain-containing protein [Rhodobacteraceae bacterium B1Z28]|uniref:Excalibur calcium-binding domain-containing protein n=1 Tax=Ruegeria haliotis TaxID=2747601 RepID=A0ABX2PST0_9RHOB|nr:excalibur calcium-binding domain-containing protein [Ruegeria haliotis]NVO56451.1 excalibur calcium-binding domain-containing protein [Ruegeria haliotis]
MFRKPAQDEVDLNPRLSKRQRRADALRRRALSPLRILIMVLALPLTTGLIAASVFLRISDYDRNEAVIHLIALAGCDAVQAIGVGPFRKGQPGYHKRNDPDGDGVACGTAKPTFTRQAVPQGSTTPSARSVGSAKFVRP